MNIKKKLAGLAQKYTEVEELCKTTQQALQRASERLERASKKLLKASENIYKDRYIVELDEYLITVVYLDEGTEPVDYINVRRKDSFKIFKTKFYRNSLKFDCLELPLLTEEQLKKLAHILDNMTLMDLNSTEGLLN